MFVENDVILKSTLQFQWNGSLVGTTLRFTNPFFEKTEKDKEKKKKMESSFKYSKLYFNRTFWRKIRTLGNSLAFSLSICLSLCFIMSDHWNNLRDEKALF